MLHARATASGLPDRDSLLVLLRLRRLRQRDREHAVLEVRLDPVGINAGRHRERTLERAIAALGEVKVLLLLLPFAPLLALDRQRAVGEFDVDVALVHARQLRRELEGVPLVDDVDGGRLAPADLATPERLNVEHAAPERRAPRAQLEILEQAVDFPPQALERPPLSRTIGLLFGFHRRLGCNFVHAVPPSSIRWRIAPLKRNARGVYRVASRRPLVPAARTHAMRGR